MGIERSYVIRGYLTGQEDFKLIFNCVEQCQRLVKAQVVLGT